MEGCNHNLTHGDFVLSASEAESSVCVRSVVSGEEALAAGCSHLHASQKLES